MASKNKVRVTLTDKVRRGSREVLFSAPEGHYHVFRRPPREGKPTGKESLSVEFEGVSDKRIREWRHVLGYEVDVLKGQDPDKPSAPPEPKKESKKKEEAS